MVNLVLECDWKGGLSNSTFEKDEKDNVINLSFMHSKTNTFE